jgi:hypothetical protein
MDEQPQQDGQGQGYLLFVSKPTGYELVERTGEPPGVGQAVELDGEEGRWLVSRVSSSPLPMDKRRCAYLQQSPS